MTIIMINPDAFHLGWMGATRRIIHISGAFKAIGLQPVLIAGLATVPQLQCPLDKAFGGRVIRTRHSGDYPGIMDQSRILRRAWRAYWKLHGEDYYWRKLSWGWADKLDVQALQKNLTQLDFRPSIVWGISAGYLEGAVAAQRVAHALHLPWVFELQDPPRRGGLGQDNEAVKAQFSALLHDAACIVVTAKSYGDTLKEGFGVDSQRIHTIHLSFDGNEQDNDSPGKVHTFTVVYAGSLDGGRSLKPLITAIAKAFDNFPMMRETFKLELAGSGPGFSEVARFSKQMGLESNINYLGLLPGEGVAVLLERAVVVVVVQENKSALQVPGKIFECLKTGKPVLGMMPTDCEAAQILVKAGLGFIREKNDIEGLCDYLIRMWEAWRRDEQIVQPDNTYIQGFSTAQLPAKLKGLLKGLIDFTVLQGDTNVRTDIRPGETL